jgi:hypothetical protein
LAHEVFHSFKKKGGSKGWIVIKLGMEKAYDRLEWNFIIHTLKVLGFSDRINVLKLLDLAISNGNLFSMRNETKFF